MAQCCAHIQTPITYIYTQVFLLVVSYLVHVHDDRLSPQLHSVVPAPCRLLRAPMLLLKRWLLQASMNCSRKILVAIGVYLHVCVYVCMYVCMYVVCMYV
jgi:hypothetical protein